MKLKFSSISKEISTAELSKNLTYLRKIKSNTGFCNLASLISNNLAELRNMSLT